MSIKSAIVALCDIITALLITIIGPALRFVSRDRARIPFTLRALDHFGIAVLPHRYYEPIVFPGDLSQPLDAERPLPAVDMNDTEQLALIRQFHYRDELLQIPMSKTAIDAFGYNNGSYMSGDAELLYDVIRHFKPRRIIEVGSGQSTLIARIALAANSAESLSPCEHICIEPYEEPWLESLGIRVIRERVERCDKNLFQTLGEDDILFIDSSHVIRPQGDVLFEYLELLPTLKKGVLIHVHDIFTPRDYLARWILKERLLWNEQYLLEAFLSFNSDFKVLLAANWLTHNHLDELSEACPILVQQPEREPGAIWLTRRT